MTFIHDEANEAPITEIYAYLSTDENGEGICGAMMGGVWTPLVTSKRRIAEAMRPVARDLEQKSGKPVKLVKFSVREEIADARH